MVLVLETGWNKALLSRHVTYGTKCVLLDVNGVRATDPDYTTQLSRLYIFVFIVFVFRFQTVCVHYVNIGGRHR